MGHFPWDPHRNDDIPMDKLADVPRGRVW